MPAVALHFAHEHSSEALLLAPSPMINTQYSYLHRFTPSRFDAPQRELSASLRDRSNRANS